jgi:uncharacterized membrane protein YdcZ (DUF606 family)
MKTFYLPIAMTVFGGVLYHVSQKSLPKTAHPLHILIIAYLAGIVLLAIASFFYATEKSFLSSVNEANWAVVAVGLGAACIEIGFLLAYRFGWDISIANVVSNIGMAVLLIPIGIFLFKEKISLTQTLGIALCIMGLILLTRK